jgi:hypothetical protein
VRKLVVSQCNLLYMQINFTIAFVLGIYDEI